MGRRKRDSNQSLPQNYFIPDSEENEENGHLVADSKRKKKKDK
jgi:hypothetical protein